MTWNVIKASVTGIGHIKNNIPCQDFCDYIMIADDCGIAIIADGAGSYDNSHIGSAFVTRKAIELFKKLILKNNWHIKQPEYDLWRAQAIYTIKEVSESLRLFADMHDYDFKSLSSTFSLCLFSKNGICSINIGDGRGAIKPLNGEWQSTITPYHGEQVGMTVFLTSNIWKDSEEYISTSVVKKDIEAFIIISDGYEKISFECYEKDDAGIYNDPNRPFSQFLNFKLNKTKELLKTTTLDEVREKWIEFLKNGHQLLAQEIDDKSMIFGLNSH